MSIFWIYGNTDTIQHSGRTQRVRKKSVKQSVGTHDKKVTANLRWNDPRIISPLIFQWSPSNISGTGYHQLGTSNGTFHGFNHFNDFNLRFLDRDTFQVQESGPYTN